MLRTRWLAALAVAGTLGLAAVPTGAGAATIYPGYTLPPGMQAGTLNVPDSCRVSLFGIPLITTQISVELAGAFPTIVAPGQSFTISGSSKITVPALLVSLLKIVGTTSVTGSATTVDITDTGGAPALVNAAATPISIPHTKLPASGSLVLSVPSSGAFTVGPITATGAAPTVNVGIGAISASVTLLNSNGATIPIPIAINCAAPKPSDILGDLSVGGSASTPSLPAPPVVAIEDVPSGAIIGSTGSQLSCTFTGLGTFPLNESLTAYAANILTLKAGVPYYGEQGHATVTTPASLTSALLSALGAQAGQASALDVSISDLDIQAQDATPADQNYASTPIPGSGSITPGSGLSLQFPPAGQPYLSPIEFTPSAAGVTYVYLGGTDGTAQVVNAAGQPIGASYPFTCPAQSPLVPLFAASVQAG